MHSLIRNTKFTPRTALMCVASCSILLLQACGSDGPGNIAPFAAAAPSTNSVSVGDSPTVELSASGSSDNDGSIQSFSWAQTSGASVTLENANAETASFQVPTITAAETLTFEVTVTDDIGATDTASVSVDVPAGSASVCPPAIGNLVPSALVSSSTAENFCQISGEITEDATLGNGYTWFLEGLLQVGNETSKPTLSIEAGTSIRGDNADTVDHLFVFAGASIQANGTAASPIHFSSDDMGYNGAAEWGGLFIRGNGDDQGDNLLDYVVVAEAGAPTEVAGTTYSDNIVINGADDGTRLTFVQSHDSNRDGIRLQNTTARLSWILVTGAARDGIWYRDFGGVVKDYMSIHRPDSGRSGIYASASSADAAAALSPRFVNVTLVGRDGASESAADDETAKEFGILFADNFAHGRYGNILIANFRNGCYEVDATADLSAPGYIDGIHCANEAGPNGNFGVVRTGGIDITNKGIGNGDGIRYYNGAANPITFTGETAARAFTAGWYLNTIGSLSNGLAADSAALNAFRNGDTNADGTVNSDDIGAAPILGASGPALANPVGSTITGFNDDVATDTGGYDLTHIGAVRTGSDMGAMQFNNWTVATDVGEGFAVPAP